jgi:hypothetical protein
MPSVLKGAFAGVVASIPGFLALYLYFCVWTGIRLGGDIAGLLLSAVTVIPLMLIFVLFLPNAALGVLVGLSLAAIARLRGAVPRMPVGLLLGVLGAHLVFRDWYPWFFKPQEDDISRIITPLPFVAAYGALFGALVWKIYRKMA